MPKFWTFNSVAATEAEPESVELRIEGDIIADDDAWLYEWFGVAATAPNAFKSELKQHAGKNITLWIDSYGGDVFAAAGIYNALMEHKGKVTVKIDGKAMSAASVIAMAGKEILMSPVALMMIHDPAVGIGGYFKSTELQEYAKYLDEVKESIINSYQIKTGRARNKISQMMDDEYYMSAKTAVKEGFADGILYADQGGTDIQDIAFNRNAVMNCIMSASQRLKDFQQKNMPPAKPDSLVPAEPPGDTEDIKSIKAKLALQLEL